jgi:hypothetical protein
VPSAPAFCGGSEPMKVGPVGPLWVREDVGYTSEETVNNGKRLLTKGVPSYNYSSTARRGPFGAWEAGTQEQVSSSSRNRRGQKAVLGPGLESVVPGR